MVLFVLCFGVDFVLFEVTLNLMYVFIVLIKFGHLSDRLLGNSSSLGLRCVF